MAYAEIFPKNKEIEKMLIEKKDNLMSSLFKTVASVYGIPQYDAIVELHQCTTIAFCKEAVEAESAPDAVIKVQTCDVEHKQEAKILGEAIVEDWNRIIGSDRTVEIWIDFFHTWNCNMEFE